MGPAEYLVGFSQPNICTVPQRGCGCTIGRLIVNDRSFELRFRIKKFTIDLHLYVFRPLLNMQSMDELIFLS